MHADEEILPENLLASSHIDYCHREKHFICETTGGWTGSNEPSNIYIHTFI